jgi:hypothetical protein
MALSTSRRCFVLLNVGEAEGRVHLRRELLHERRRRRLGQVDVLKPVRVRPRAVVTLVVVQLGGLELRARKVLGWPTRCKLAQAFLREYSCKRLKLAQLLGQPGVFLTWPQTGESVVPFHTTYSV